MRDARRTAAVCTWTDFKANTGFAEELIYPQFWTKYRTTRKKNWVQYVNRMIHNRSPRIIKQLQTKRQKELGKTIGEVSGRETGMGQQVVRLRDSYIMTTITTMMMVVVMTMMMMMMVTVVVVVMMMMMMMYNTVRFKISKQLCIY